MPQEPAPSPPPPGPPPTGAPALPGVAPVPRVDFRVGDVLRRSFRIWFRNYVPFTALSVVLAAPFLLFSIYLRRTAPGDDQTRLLVSLLQMTQLTIEGFLLTGAFTYAVFRQLRGQPAGLSRCVSIAVSRLLPMLGVSLLTLLALIGGCILFCVPGLIALAALWVTVPVSVVERQGLFNTLQRSIDLTRGARFPILGLVLLIVSCLGTVSLATQIVFGGSLTDPAAEERRTIVAGLVHALLGAFYPVANAVTYHDLRVAKEGVGTDELLRVFE